MNGAKRILAIETSGRLGSIAALWGAADGSRLAEQIALSHNERTAQALAPALQRLLNSIGWAPDSVDLVCVAIGPGSFTGLRIGVTTAKTFAYAVGADVIGVNTLEVLALQTPASAAPLWAVSDAQRQELFGAKFQLDGTGEIRCVHETEILTQELWLSGLQPGDRVTGTALTRVQPKLPTHVEVVDSLHWQPMAAAVGQLAWQKYQAGHRDDLWTLVPNYYRASAAEEKNPL